MTDGGSTDYEGAIGNRFSYRLEFFGAGKNGRCSDGGTRAPKCYIIGIHHSQVAKSKVAHGPGSCANVEGIARVDQDDAQAIGFIRKRQAVFILRQPALR